MPECGALRRGDMHEKKLLNLEIGKYMQARSFRRISLKLLVFFFPMCIIEVG